MDYFTVLVFLTDIKFMEFTYDGVISTAYMVLQQQKRAIKCHQTIGYSMGHVTCLHTPKCLLETSQTPKNWHTTIFFLPLLGP